MHAVRTHLIISIKSKTTIQLNAGMFILIKTRIMLHLVADRIESITNVQPLQLYLSKRGLMIQK